jgi:hypothetical protein
MLTVDDSAAAEARHASVSEQGGEMDLDAIRQRDQVVPALQHRHHAAASGSQI